jgi:hypothetical protein
MHVTKVRIHQSPAPAHKTNATRIHRSAPLVHGSSHRGHINKTLLVFIEPCSLRKSCVWATSSYAFGPWPHFHGVASQCLYCCSPTPCPRQAGIHAYINTRIKQPSPSSPVPAIKLENSHYRVAAFSTRNQTKTCAQIPTSPACRSTAASSTSYRHGWSSCGS